MKTTTSVSMLAFILLLLQPFTSIAGPLSYSGLAYYDNVENQYLEAFPHDFNSDGAPDILALEWDLNIGLAVFMNNGDGTFAAPQHCGTDNVPSAAAVSDLDNDGLEDIAVVQHGNWSINNPFWHDGATVIFWNDGAGSYSSVDLRSEYYESPEHVVVADLNGDGLGDVLTLHSTGWINRVRVYLNLGARKFTEPADYFFKQHGLSSMAVADFDGDGRPDLAADIEDDSFINSVSILRNNGDGTFSGYASSSTPGYYIHNISAEDFDKDGKVDLLAVASPFTYGEPQELILYANKGDGNFVQKSIFSGEMNIYHVRSGDLDGDSFPDICFNPGYPYEPGDEIHVLINDKSGSFETPLIFKVGNNPLPSGAADFDQDGKDDMLIVVYSGLGALINNTGDPSDVTISCFPAAGGTAQPSGQLNAENGTIYELSAIPAAGYSFVKWTAIPAINASFTDSASAVTEFTVIGDVSITANFAVPSKISFSAKHRDFLKNGNTSWQDNYSLTSKIQLPASFDLAGIGEDTVLAAEIGIFSFSSPISATDKKKYAPEKGGYATFITKELNAKQKKIVTRTVAFRWNKKKILLTRISGMPLAGTPNANIMDMTTVSAGPVNDIASGNIQIDGDGLFFEIPYSGAKKVITNKDHIELWKWNAKGKK